MGGSFNLIDLESQDKVDIYVAPPSETRSERQWQDCCELAVCNDLDVTYLRTWADHLGVREDLEEMLEQRRAAW